MALDITNHTGFTCQPMPLLSEKGAHTLRLVVKTSYAVTPSGELMPSRVPHAVVMADEYWGKPGESSVRYESDVGLPRPQVDLLIHGDACTPQGRQATDAQVTLRYDGRLLKQLHVRGDRSWERGALGLRPSRATPFTRMPLRYERAYGGCADGTADPRNPIGTGYKAAGRGGQAGTPLPNITYVDEVIESTQDRARPAGLGPVARHWRPRLEFAGTYDQSWLDERYPLLPTDFDPRFNQSAPTDQWLPLPRGGELIELTGMTERGPFVARVPPPAIPLQLRYKDRTLDTQLTLDTLLLEPGDALLKVAWRATIDIHGDPFRLRELIVGHTASAKPSADCCNIEDF